MVSIPIGIPLAVGNRLYHQPAANWTRVENPAALTPLELDAVPLVKAFAGYALLTVVMLWPVVAHLASRVPHDLGDPLLSIAILWWNAHALPLSERWWNGFAFWPATGMLAFSDHRLGESLIASPLQWMGFGPVAAHNVTLLAMFPLCAIAAHWFVFTIT